MSKDKQTAKQAAKVAGAFKDVKVKAELAKSAVIIIRASATVKAEMQATAKGLGLSLTEYLTNLHALAKAQLK